MDQTEVVAVAIDVIFTKAIKSIKRKKLIKINFFNKKGERKLPFFETTQLNKRVILSLNHVPVLQTTPRKRII